MTFKIFNFFIILLLISGSCKVSKDAKLDSPRKIFAELFEEVQSKEVFDDSKTFTDYIAKRDPKLILKDYNKESVLPGFNLNTFVLNNFTPPDTAGSEYISNRNLGAEQHIDQLWQVLTRPPDVYQKYSSLIELPNAYVVPGGRFREIYYWDSYFTMLGLEESGRVDLIENIVNNFAWLIRSYGFVPNGNRTYYLTRSQPPYFSLMVELLMKNKALSSDSVLIANKDALEKEYRFWMSSNKNEKASEHVVQLENGEILNRYFDKGNWPREEAYKEDVTVATESGREKEAVYRELRSGAESGWDFSSRWFGDTKSLESIRTTEIIPVDLNCLLYHLEVILSNANKVVADSVASASMLKLASKRKAAIQKYLWDESSGWYKDYDWKNAQKTENLTLAGVYPLFFKMATPEQAKAVSATLQTNFLKPGGLVTTLANTGQQWDSPNGWAPLQWMAIAGLNNYNQQPLAREISNRWSSLNVSVFKKTGKLLEKYNVVDTTLIAGGGEYPNQDGFGWTNGVLLKLLKRQNEVK